MTYQPGDRFEWQQEAYEVHAVREGWLYYWHDARFHRVLATKVAWLPTIEAMELEKKRLRDLGRSHPRYSFENQSKEKPAVRLSGRKGNYNHLR